VKKEQGEYILCKRTGYSFLYTYKIEKESNKKKKKAVVHREQMIELAHMRFIDRKKGENEREYTSFIYRKKSKTQKKKKKSLVFLSRNF
jgi:hypothetical protein